MEKSTTEESERIRGFELLAERAEGIVDEMVSAMRAEIPAYRSVPAEALRPDTLAHFLRGLAVLRDRRRSTSAEIKAIRAMGARRAQLGLPLEAVLQGTRAAVFRGWELSLETAEEVGVSASLLLDEMHAAWQWADETTGYAAEGHRSAWSDEDHRSGRRRADFVRRLLRGALPVAEIEDEALAHGLVPSASYVAFRARPSAELGLASLRRAIEVHGHVAGRAPLVTDLDGDVVGIFAGKPQFHLNAMVGLGPPAPLHAIESSFRLSARILEAGMDFGLRGLLGLEDLSLKLAVVSEQALGETLVSRYLEPLDGEGEFGSALQTTVSEYLRLGMRVEETAHSLKLHPNTVRHRLDRFEKLTGADVRAIGDIVEIWWALERRQLEWRRERE